MRLAPAGALLMLTAAPLFAQTAIDPNQPANNGSAAASATVPPGGVAPGVDPRTLSANLGVAGNIAAQNSVTNANQAQYQADLAAYDVSLANHGQQAARYARQRQAYAQAMAAWRVQADACARGKSTACKAPAPDPADYY